MTWYHPALAQRALDEGDRELARLRAEIVRLQTDKHIAGMACDDLRRELAEAGAEIERLRTAITFVVEKFEKDEAQGYHTRDREFAITILRKSLGDEQEMQVKED